MFLFKWFMFHLTCHLAHKFHWKWLTIHCQRDQTPWSTLGKRFDLKKATMIPQRWKMCSCYHNWTVRIPSEQVCRSQAWCLWFYNTEGSLTEGKNWRQMGQMIHYLIPHISMLYCLLFQRKSIWLEQMSQGEQSHCTRAISF